MKRCPTCGKSRTKAGKVEHRWSVAGVSFRAELAARVCSSCGEQVVAASDLAAVELQAAAVLACRGAASPEAFRFMRKAVGLRASDLAELLDVASETISRWETGALPAESRAFALLGSIVVDRLEGREDTEQRLRARLSPRRPTGIVRLAVTRPRRRAKVQGSAAAR